MFIKNKFYDDGRRFPGSNDTVFKNLFKNKEILCYYLKYFTEFDIKPEEVKEGNGETKFSIDSKGIRMDLKFDIVNSLSLDLEMQNEVEDDEAFKRRLIHYLSLMYSSAFDAGSKYEEKKIAALVVFVNTENTIFEPLMHFKLRDDSSTTWDDIQIYIINIPKYIKDFNNENKNDIIKVRRKLLDVLTTKDGSKYKNDDLLFRRVEEVINIMNKEDALRFEMYKAEAYKTELIESGKKEWKIEGKIEGQIEEKNNIIRTMAKNGCAPNEISKLLDLELPYIEEVLKQS